MKSLFFTGCFAAGILIAAQSSSRAAGTNTSTQAGSRQAAPTVRVAPQPGVAATSVGGLLGVMTDQQRVSYQEVMRNLRPKFVEFESQLRAAREDLFNSSLSVKFDEKTIRQKAQTVANLEAETTVLRIKVLSMIQPPLTQDQIERMRAEHAGAMRPFERPLPPRTGPTTNQDATGLPPKH